MGNHQAGKGMEYQRHEFPVNKLAIGVFIQNFQELIANSAP
jgi:hypothetical protein